MQTWRYCCKPVANRLKQNTFQLSIFTIHSIHIHTTIKASDKQCSLYRNMPIEQVPTLLKSLLPSCLLRRMLRQTLVTRKREAEPPYREYTHNSNPRLIITGGSPFQNNASVTQEPQAAMQTRSEATYLQPCLRGFTQSPFAHNIHKSSREFFHPLQNTPGTMVNFAKPPMTTTLLSATFPAS